MSNRDMFREDDDALFAPIGEHPADHVPAPPSDKTDERVPLSIIDKYFDGDLTTDDSRSFFEKLRRRPDRALEAVWMQRAIDALKKPVSSPDFSKAILRSVADRRAWLPRRDRIAVWALRYAAVLLLVGMSAAAYTLQRVAPEATALTPRVTPVGNVVDAVSQSTETAARAFPNSLATMQRSVFFDRTQVSLASFSQSNRADHPAPHFPHADAAAVHNCISAVGLRYSDHQTTVCDDAHAAERTAKPRVHMIIISTSKK